MVWAGLEKAEGSQWTALRPPAKSLKIQHGDTTSMLHINNTDVTAADRCSTGDFTPTCTKLRRMSSTFKVAGIILASLVIAYWEFDTLVRGCYLAHGGRILV
jgi:hypothetical protein